MLVINTSSVVEPSSPEEPHGIPSPGSFLNHLHLFLDNSSALDLFQCAFRSGYGTEIVLVALIGDLYLNVDKGSFC